MTSTISPSLTARRIENFCGAPLGYVDLDDRGNRVKGTKTVTVYFTHLTERSPTNAFDAIVHSVRRVFERFCPCPRNYVTALSQEQATLPTRDYARHYQVFIDRLRAEHPIQFEITEENEQNDTLPPSLFDPALLTRIQAVLEAEGMQCPADHLSRLLIAREHALTFHREKPEYVVSVSSKSPYFRVINEAIIEGNRLRESIEGTTNEPFKSTASLRVFPNEVTALTAIGLPKIYGGNKVVTCDILIGAQGQVSLARRAKQKDHLRPDRSSSYENSINLSARVTDPHILTPEIVFSTTKGIQFLTPSYPTDAFSFLTPYYHLATGEYTLDHPEVGHIVTTPITIQVSQTIKYMIDIARGLQALYKEKILLNDTKPENILIHPLTGKAVIFDFDAACTVEEGKSLTIHRGTLDYFEHSKTTKDLSTELYSLALTYWMNFQPRRQEHPGFMDVFISLRKIAGTRSEAPRIANLISSLQQLCSDMKKGVTSRRGPILTYDEVISRLSAMEEAFAKP